MTVCNTSIETKNEQWPIFAELISGQFKHGGVKYGFDTFKNMEVTDLIDAEVLGNQNTWPIANILKYAFRLLKFRREKDWIKIATYAYLGWLKQGCHLNIEHDTDTSTGQGKIEDKGCKIWKPTQESQ